MSLLIQQQIYVFSAIPFVIVLAATLSEFVFADILAEHRYPYTTELKLLQIEQKLGISAAHQVQEKLRRTIDSLSACDKTLVSAVVHLVIDLMPTADSSERRGLMQVTDYVGVAKGSKGRITAMEKGIIGRCARTGRIEVVNFRDSKDYLSRMVSEFGFLATEATKHTRSARSYLAVPLKIESEVRGVLYLFSPEAQIFPGAARDSRLDDTAKDIVGLLQTASIL
jgi:hypothetical protein